MNLKTKFRTPELPKLLADLKHANQFLKVFALASLLVSLLSMGIGLALFGIFKGPTIVALAPSGDRLIVDDRPKPEIEIESAIRHYIQHRYTWDAKTVRESLKNAKFFIRSEALRSFEAGTNDIQKFAIDRNASQRGYAATLKVDLKTQTVQVRGDRVTTIQGLTAAGPLSLSLTFESGQRTMENPWGVYVTRERNE